MKVYIGMINYTGTDKSLIVGVYRYKRDALTETLKKISDYYDYYWGEYFDSERDIETFRLAHKLEEILGIEYTAGREFKGTLKPEVLELKLKA